jgi:thiol:disulfide interchange protein DsbC
VNRNKKIYFRFAFGIYLVISNFVFISEISDAASFPIQTLTMRLAQSDNNIDFNHLPFNQSIKIIKGNGSKKIAVFYEIDCGYCRYLERYELSQIKNVTVYTFLFTNDENESAVSWKKAESIWCAANVNEAWQDFIFKNDIAINYEACKNPIKENKMLALKLGVKATPTIIFSNGNKAVGMIKAKDIEQRLLDANFYSN